MEIIVMLVLLGLVMLLFDAAVRRDGRDGGAQ